MLIGMWRRWLESTLKALALLFFSLNYILSLCRKEDIDMKQKVLTWLMIVTVIIGIVANVLRISIYKEELK